MHMEMILKNNKKRIINICIIFIILVLYLLLFAFKLEIPCMFKSILGISCPSCGMTRAIDSILKFNFYEAFKYNILSIPLVVLGCISIFVVIYDIIKNTDKFIQTANNIFTKYWYIIILACIISMVINNIKHI